MSVRSVIGQAGVRLAQAVATPLVPEDYLDVFAPLHGSSLRARVVAVLPETGDAVTVVLHPGHGWAGHTPGQFVRLGVDVEGVRHWRSYSITSRPDERHLTITVRMQGAVSHHLAQSTSGTIVELQQAMGEFGIRGRPPAKCLFVTAGSGITPVMGLLRAYRLPDALVVHSARTAQSVIFGDELRAMAGTGEFTLIEHHTADAPRLVAADLPRLVPDISERRTWVCGPNDLINAVEQYYADRGWEPPTSERFRAKLAAAGQGGSVEFTRSGSRAEAPGDTALLDVGEAAGVLMPSGCRMGICYGCVLPLAEGSVRDLRDGSATTAGHESPVLIQTCINAAAGPCSLTV